MHAFIFLFSLISDQKTCYSTLKLWIFTGEVFTGSHRDSDLLRKELKERYFSELPGNIKDVKFGKLRGNSFS